MGSSSSTMEVTDRASLWKALHGPSGGDASSITACMCTYSPPPKRLIIRSAADFARLGTTKEAVHAACDPTFWAFGDFESIFDSFSRNETDKERRVMGIEGVGSAAALLEAIDGGEPCLKIGHLSLLMMQGKVENGEWLWVDEANCVMHTATPKPALLRAEVKARLGVEFRVMRHEVFAAAAESLGDLIIFDLDKSDVRKETGNTKVFCQEAKNYSVLPFDTLSDEMKAAVMHMLAVELAPS